MTVAPAVTTISTLSGRLTVSTSTLSRAVASPVTLVTNDASTTAVVRRSTAFKSAAAWPAASAAIVIVSTLSSAGSVFSVAIAVVASTVAVITPEVSAAIFRILATVAVPVISTVGLPIEISFAVI